MYPDFYRREHPDDEYLFEFDLNEKGRMQFDTDGTSAKFTDRAKAAQEAVRMLTHFERSLLMPLTEMEEAERDLRPAKSTQEKYDGQQRRQPAPAGVRLGLQAGVHMGLCHTPQPRDGRV